MSLRSKILVVAVAAACSLGAAAQEVTLKVHHFWPPGAMPPTKILQPWCDKLASESGNRLKCQVFPAMQLGGTPAQLIVVGDGPYRVKMEAELAGSPAAFLGFRHGAELSAIYAASDLFAFPSTTDTLGV